MCCGECHVSSPGRLVDLRLVKAYFRHWGLVVSAHVTARFTLRFAFQTEREMSDANKRDTNWRKVRTDQNRRWSPESKLLRKKTLVFFAMRVMYLHRKKVSVFHLDARRCANSIAPLTFSNLTARLTSPSLVDLLQKSGRLPREPESTGPTHAYSDCRR